MASKYIKNEDNVQHTRLGVPIPAGEYYLIPPDKEVKWANDPQVLADIANNILVVAKTPDEQNDLDNIAEGIAFLRGELPVQIDGAVPVHQFPLAEADNLRARLLGFMNDTIPAGEEKNLDFQIPLIDWLGTNKQSYMDGIQYYAKNAEVGDSMKFQVVDKDGVAYPADTVLDEFGTNWYVMPNSETTIRLYKAKLIPFLYIRIKYKSTGQEDVKVVCNLFRHMATDENL